ncbi:hypothetical protein TNCV_2133631 [Trichonephila clavipes]|nr:hypothetical protein TNCV_2133631 [Trichonephila clavipes]
MHNLISGPKTYRVSLELNRPTGRYLKYSSRIIKKAGTRACTRAVFFPLIRTYGKKKLSLQEAMDQLQNLPFEIRDALTKDSSDEDVPENNLQKTMVLQSTNLIN